MAESIRRRALILALVVLTTIAADQLHKWYMLTVVDIANRPPIYVTDFFRLVMVWNQGVSFGMLSHDASYMVWGLILMAVTISAILLRMAMKSPLAVERVAYGMIAGGALGNAIDRVRFGAVADFFHFYLGSFSWPAFNVADASIFLGVVTLLWMMTFHPSKP